MRLLQYNNNGDLSLTEFDESDIPEYAILSHTWEQDNSKEVSYAEVISRTGQDKEGFKKIRFCGEQARQDGLPYFWVDTCCINKQNKAELRHSINSMFRWYRNASRCYVYLSDVSTRKRKASEQSSEHTWELSFRESRWFTRGWTLQELLAPASVEFFCFEGKRLGDKGSLQKQICKATNISLSALHAKSLSQFHIDERMRWIEHRETSQEEDKVYSLLGIFGVSMVPDYGEGVTKAFDRLWDRFREIQKCMQDLRPTDPRLDKERIEATKGGLLQEAYRWVIEASDFQQWRTNQHNRLLWIKGDPGKGKTMLLCGIADELQTSLAKSALLSYFFCQATDSRINRATAVLRGLIYLLVDQQPSLVSHVQTSYDTAGKALFEDANAWIALIKIFSSILHDPNLPNTYLIVDALDECVVDLPRLLGFIAQTSSVSTRVKWIVSSRNWPEIEKTLDTAMQKQRLCLELNADSVSSAVATFIEAKVHDLSMHNKYKSEIRAAVLQHLSLNANGTFLWVALVCQELSTLSGWKAVQKLDALPPGLDALYQRMLGQIMASVDSELCMSILAVVSTVYRPITLDELVTLVKLPNGVDGDYEALAEIIGYCRSFLAIRERTIFFVHQSAKDFLIGEAPQEPLLLKAQDVHNNIFSRSLQAMSMTLRRDIYNLRAPGIDIKQVKQPESDPLTAIRYSCLYWVDHLLQCQTREERVADLKDKGLAYSFLRQNFLYWLEALSLLKCVSDGVVMIRKLENLQVRFLVVLSFSDYPNVNKCDRSPDLRAFIQDATRFAISTRSVIEQAPLQAYCSALVFAPEESIVRKTFEQYIPSWIQRKPRVEAHWTAMLQTLEGHFGPVMSVAFSPDGTQVVSGSYDQTVRLWDAATGALQQTLEGHSGPVMSVAFSPDGTQVVSGSDDQTARLWDAATGALQQTLEGHFRPVMSVAFSPDGTQVVSGSYDQTVRLWDAATGALQQTLEGHFRPVMSVAFSPDGTQVVSGSDDQTARLWDAATGALQQTLEGHFRPVMSVAFSPDSTQVVSGSSDQTVRLWDAATGALQQTLKGHSGSVTSVAFSPDGTQVVSGSYNQTVRLWDAATGALQQTLEGHSRPVMSVAFSPDGTQVVSGSYDQTVRLWDAATRALQQTLEGHSGPVMSVAFSPDGTQVVSGSSDQTVRLWDAATGALQQTLKGHSDSVMSVAFSPDGTQVVSGSSDQTVRLWDAATGALQQTLEGHSRPVISVAFSPDGTQVASGSYNQTVRLWDAATGALQQTLEGHSGSVMSIAFSPDGTQVASGSYNQTVRLWDAATGALQQTLEGHSGPVMSVAFSPDGTQVVSGSSDQTARLWDAATGALQQTLEGHSGPVTSVAFSPDGKHIPTLHVSGEWLVEGTARYLWLPTSYRPTCEAIWGRIVIMGHSSGRLSFLQIKPGLQLSI